MILQVTTKNTLHIYFSCNNFIIVRYYDTEVPGLSVSSYRRNIRFC
ncbi:MAG: hypothetical protein H6Q52_2987, partial [Deltaproteobacteria bacterium]|nr:hypothetical protein [Deltaproteobacteria bacterium]